MEKKKKNDIVDEFCSRAVVLSKQHRVEELFALSSRCPLGMHTLTAPLEKPGALEVLEGDHRT